MTRFTWPDAFSSTSTSLSPMKTMPIGWISPDDTNVVTSRFGSRIVTGVVSAAAGDALMIHAATAANHVRAFMLASVRAGQQEREQQRRCHGEHCFFDGSIRSSHPGSIAGTVKFTDAC